MWQWLVRNWLQNLAQEKIRETVVQAAQEQLAAATQQAEEAKAPPPPADVGLVFAVESESGGLEDLLQGLLIAKAGGFVFAQGMLHERRVVIVRSGAGQRSAAEATRLLLDVHKPAWVISSGFAGALDPALKRGDLVAANELVDQGAQRLSLELTLDPQSLAKTGRLQQGRLLTVDRIVRTPAEKRALGQQHGALAVDMESLAVAEVCRQRQARFLAIRIIFDAVGDELPADVERLVRQRTSAARFGAALGAIVNRPGSLKDMYNLKEQALLNADRLARFLAAVIGQLPPGVATQSLQAQ